MDIENRKKTIFNIGLARLISLYQHLNPHSTKIRGYTVYHITNICIGFFMITVSMLGPFGLYHLMNDVIAFIFYLGCIINLPFSCYKIFIIIYYAKDLWICCEIGSYNFLSYQKYNKHILKTWRRKSTIISSALTTMAIMAIIIWTTTPYIFNKIIVTIKNIDGSYSKYRMNIFNLYFIVSAETYNKYFNEFYVLETIMGVFYMYFTIVFDILMIFMCFAICSQLETISDGMKSLGHNRTMDNFSKYDC